MVYDVYNGKPGSFFAKLEKLVKSLTGLALPLDIRGQYPFTWFFFPKRRPINTVVGAPIDFCQLKNHSPGEEPSRELVDDCHEMYLKALRQLYYENKAKFGDEDKPLVYC